MTDKLLREQLINLLKGGRASVTFESALENVGPGLRNKRPSENIHSVWENLEHMRIAQEDILKYTVDKKWKSPVWPEGYWPDDKRNIDDEKWKNSLSSFLNDRDELIKLVLNENIGLTSKIPHTDGHTYLREILIVAEHNAYHLGQILTARKLLNDWKN
jgi:uncharacterized damage-inducible protein DinB